MLKILGLLVMLGCGVSWAQNNQEQIRAVEKEMLGIQRRQKTFANQVKQEQQNKWQAEQVLDYLDNNAQQLELELAQARGQISRVRVQLIKTNEDLARLDKLVNNTAVERQQQIIGLYKLGRAKASSWLPTAKVFRVYLRNRLLLKQLARNTAIKLQTFEPLIVERKEQQAVLQEKNQRLNDLLERERDRFSSLKREQQQQKAHLRQTKRKQATQLQSIQTLEQALLTAQSRLKQLKHRSANQPQNELLGLNDRLILPVEGRLIKPFGTGLSQEYAVHQRGVIVQSFNPQHEVKAVKGGQVVFMNRMRVFNNLVVIDHGRSDFSVYGYLGKVYVQKDQWLKQGEKLGKLSPPSNQKDFLLYFELRLKGKSVDPMPLLGKEHWQ